MHQKIIIAYRQGIYDKNGKFCSFPEKLHPKISCLLLILTWDIIHIDSENICNWRERMISFLEEATWSHKYHYYTAGTSARNPSSVQTLLWKPFGHSRSRKMASQTPVPEWQGIAKGHICFHQIQHTNTWTLQGTQPVLLPCQSWTRKIPPQGTQDYWKSWCLLQLVQMGKKAKPTQQNPQTNHSRWEKNEKKSYLIVRQLCLFFHFHKRESTNIWPWLYHSREREESPGRLVLSQNRGWRREHSVTSAPHTQQNCCSVNCPQLCAQSHTGQLKAWPAHLPLSVKCFHRGNTSLAELTATWISLGWNSSALQSGMLQA